ncbi:DivIVA domain-containing protein [Fusibacter sp. JL216-2]|uniref:DivIVA domain-containing protein n=1 Tax=Fusibacter sp. JL216-2 TaxID=3071453 RepID=UPI003D342B65
MENEFKKVMRGYDIEEVNRYIDRMSSEFENKFSEKRSELEMLKKKNDNLSQSLIDLKSSIKDKEKKKNSEFQAMIGNLESKLSDKERLLEQITMENNQIKESIETRVKEKDYELSRLLKIKENQIKELENELIEMKSNANDESEEIKKLKKILSEREEELRELSTNQESFSSVEVIQLEEKMRTQEQIIKDLTVKLNNISQEHDKQNFDDLETQKQRIANAILNANEQAEKILFQAKIEADKIEKETQVHIEQEKRKIEKLRENIMKIKSMTGDVLTCYGQSIDTVLQEIENTYEENTQKKWSVING